MPNLTISNDMVARQDGGCRVHPTPSLAGKILPALSARKFKEITSPPGSRVAELRCRPTKNGELRYFLVQMTKVQSLISSDQKLKIKPMGPTITWCRLWRPVVRLAVDAACSGPSSSFVFIVSRGGEEKGKANGWIGTPFLPKWYFLWPLNFYRNIYILCDNNPHAPCPLYKPSGTASQVPEHMGSSFHPGLTLVSRCLKEESGWWLTKWIFLPELGLSKINFKEVWQWSREWWNLSSKPFWSQIQTIHQKTYLNSCYFQWKSSQVCMFALVVLSFWCWVDEERGFAYFLIVFVIGLFFCDFPSHLSKNNINYYH